MIEFQVLIDPDEKFGMYSNQDLEMYYTYKSELWDILGCEYYSKNVVSSWYNNILRSKSFLIRILDSSDLIGFIVIAFDENCPKPFDYYIWDCYIIPEYRNKSIISGYMKIFIKNHPGKYCLFLIENNISAKNLWSSIFSNCGYKKIKFHKSKEILEMEDEKCHFYGYNVM